MKPSYNRRQFLKKSAQVAAGMSVMGFAYQQPNLIPPKPALFKISLAEWSLHRSIFGPSLKMVQDRNWTPFAAALHRDPRSVLQGELDHLNFAWTARHEFGIEAVEYVNTFFFDRARDRAFLQDMKTRADGEGVRSLLIMCDLEGNLGDPDSGVRRTAAENHFKWVEAAQFLGCHSIRVNAISSGSYDEQQKLVADGLHQLAEFADEREINVIVENHGGLSSDGQWLTGVMKLANHPRVGTLPDFGNFRISDTERYDNYLGVAELIPYAKGVSAKSYEFDEQSNESTLDYRRLLKIVLEAGYHGYIGIEYEGKRLSEAEGIRATKVLLERLRAELTPDIQGR